MEFTGEDNDDDLTLSDPKCGCCLEKVSITIIPGEEYKSRNQKTFVHFSCRCQESTIQCFLCGRCPSCCRCTVPAYEKKWSVYAERKKNRRLRARDREVADGRN